MDAADGEGGFGIIFIRGEEFGDKIFVDFVIVIDEADKITGGF